MTARGRTTPKELVRRYRARLAGLRRRKRFVHRGQSGGYARELQGVLAELKAGVLDPRTGVELVADFYRADAAVFEQCDDSDGNVGDVYRFDAQELFVSYAAACKDKEWLADLVMELIDDDGYGVRFELLKEAARYLSEPAMRGMVERLWPRFEAEPDEFEKRHLGLVIETVAEQLGDACLFERTRLVSWGPEHPGAFHGIAEVYLEAGDAGTALAWMERIPQGYTFRGREQDELLLRIHAALGNAAEQEEIAWRIFRGSRGPEGLEELLSIIGEEQRGAVVAGERAAILEDGKLNVVDALFLANVGETEAAARYVVERAKQLEGEYYSGLLALAEPFEAEGYLLAASLICRALLESILARAQSRYYHHGVRYLRRLDKLAPRVGGWQGGIPHEDYLAELRRAHARKRAFWGRYDP